MTKSNFSQCQIVTVFYSLHRVTFFTIFIQQTTTKKIQKIKFDTRQRIEKKCSDSIHSSPDDHPECFNEILICVAHTHTRTKITFIVRPAVKVDSSSLTIPNLHPSVILSRSEFVAARSTFTMDLPSTLCRNKIVFYFNRRNMRTCVS